MAGQTGAVKLPAGNPLVATFGDALLEAPTHEPWSKHNTPRPRNMGQGASRHPQQLNNLAEIDVHTTPEVFKSAAKLLSEAAEDMTNKVMAWHEAENPHLPGAVVLNVRRSLMKDVMGTGFNVATLMEMLNKNELWDRERTRVTDAWERRPQPYT